MGAPKKPRKKAPPKELKYPKRGHQKGKKSYFAKLMETEEGRALRREWSTKPRKRAGRPVGVVDGYTEEMLKPIREKSAKEAKRIVEIMSDQYNIDDEYAKEALEAAVRIMREPAQNRDKLTAARLVLDFCKSKPASKNELTIGRAEDFLTSLLENDEKEEPYVVIHGTAEEQFGED